MPDDTTPPADPSHIEEILQLQDKLDATNGQLQTLHKVVADTDQLTRQDFNRMNERLDKQMDRVETLEHKLQLLRDDFTAAVAAKTNLTDRMRTVENFLEQLRQPGDAAASPLADRTKDAVLHLAGMLSKPDSPGHPRQRLFHECARIIAGVPPRETAPAEPVTQMAPEGGLDAPKP